AGSARRRSPPASRSAVADAWPEIREPRMGAAMDVRSHRPGCRARAAVPGTIAPGVSRARGGPRPDAHGRATKGDGMIHLPEKNQERKRVNGLIAKSPMQVPGAVGELSKRVFSDGALSKKHEELTALTVAVVQNCFD